MRRMSAWVLSLLAAVAVGAVVAMIWQDRTAPPRTGPRTTPEAPAPAGREASPSQPQPPRDAFLQIEGTTLSAADPAGRPLWDLRATQLAVDNTKQRVVLTAVSGQFYTRGVVQVTFRAPRAVFHVASRDVEMTGGVVGRTVDGRTLRASRVRWNAGQRTLQAAGGVTLTQPGVGIQADLLVADAALDQARFSGNVLVQVTE